MYSSRGLNKVCKSLGHFIISGTGKDGLLLRLILCFRRRLTSTVSKKYFFTSSDMTVIEITAWLASAYEFYARVVKVHNKNRTNEPTMQ